MQHGEYKLAVQRNNRGYYAKVSLDVVVNETDWGVVVEYDFQNQWLEQWHSAIAFGVICVRHLLPAGFGRGLSVLIRDVHYNPVDTTPLTLTFATMFALFNALGWTPANQPTFDPDRGLLIPTVFAAHHMPPD
jgi:hypothetical protein